MNYFPSYRHFKNKIELELDLSNYATKFDLKLARGVDTQFAIKENYLANLELEIDKLESVPSGLSSLKSKVDKSDADRLASVPND